ncbi:hypothetical protein GGX14DRAFT_398211 [Mycena pura]|uniref:Uncharacterized protein n=1 Tax=Mycena pura TaxID=153505 RepID=A0AAD6V962_9AGAR|nr:hypothetical protein GGX14DRAFT_398211 [Mycena pura]
MHSVGAHVADVLATSKAHGGRGSDGDAGRGRVFRATQTPRGGGGRTAVGAWTWASVPCDANAARGQGPDGSGGRGHAGVRGRGRGHRARTGVPCDADAARGRGSDGGWGVDTGTCSVRCKHHARGGGQRRWGGRRRGCLRARAWPLGTDGRSVRPRHRAGVGVSAACDMTKETRGQGARTWRLSTGSSTTQRRNAPSRNTEGQRIPCEGCRHRASQAATALSIDNEAPCKTAGAVQRQGRGVAKGGGDMQPAGAVCRAHRQRAEGGERRARRHRDLEAISKHRHGTGATHLVRTRKGEPAVTADQLGQRTTMDSHLLHPTAALGHMLE